MAMTKFDNILKDKDTKKVIEKASTNLTLEKEKEVKKPHAFQIRFEDNEEYKKVWRYAKSRKMSVNTLIMNMLSKKGII